MPAVPQQPEPGGGTRRITTFAKKKLDAETTGPPVTFQPPTDEAPVPRNVGILNSDAIKHGPTPNCAGCRASAANTGWSSAHAAACRKRMEVLMMTDDDGRRRVELASETITKHLVGITGDIAEEEDTNKRRREEMDDATAAENLAADQPTSRTLLPAAPPGAVLGPDLVRNKKLIESLRRETDD